MRMLRRRSRLGLMHCVSAVVALVTFACDARREESEGEPHSSGKTAPLADEELVRAVQAAFLDRPTARQIEESVGREATLNTTRPDDRYLLDTISIVPDETRAEAVPNIRDAVDVVYWVRPGQRDEHGSPRVIGVVWKPNGAPQLFWGVVLPP